MLKESPGRVAGVSGTLEKTRIYLVDDHPLMRDSLTAILSEQPDFLVCGEADNASGALREMRHLSPDLAIIDLSLKDGSGLDLVKLVKAHLPAMQVFILSMHDERLYAERCIRTGAQGYIMKSESAKTIVDSIRKVLSGKKCVSESVTAALAERVLSGGGDDGSLVREFSNRELEVFDLLGQGLGTRQIAASLNISAKTVQTYLWRIRQKLCLSSVTELARKATLWRDERSHEAALHRPLAG